MAVLAATGAGLLGWFTGRHLRRPAHTYSRDREVLAAVADQSTDAIIACARDGTVTVWNKGAERLCGWSAEEVLGTPFRGLRAEEPRAVERSARAARLESLGQLAGGVAHDFNNLLAIILNYADFLADEVTGDSAADLSRIRDAADRARALTEQLLLFAKREPTQAEVVDLNEAVNRSGELLTRTIGADVRLVCRPCGAAVPVYANRGRLDQILLNLVINARDAMPDGVSWWSRPASPRSGACRPYRCRPVVMPG